MELTRDAILDLCRLRDPVGVLSLYVGTTPERQVHSQPEWAIVLKNELRDLRNRVKEEEPRNRWSAVHERLDALAPEIEWLDDPKEHGRGRAVFAPVSDDAVERVAIQMPLPDDVVFSESAYVRPLVSVLDEGRPAGVAVVDRSGVRLLEIAFGEAKDLGVFDFTEPTEEWRQLKGPAGANPALGQHGAPQRDLFEERLKEHIVRYVKTIGAEELPKYTGRRGWDRLVVGGESRFAQPFVEALPNRDGLEVVRTEHELRQLPSTDVARSVLPLLTESQRRREQELAERAREAALGGGQGALGLSDVCGSLAEGRVQHLVFDEGIEVEGFRTADGRLIPSDGDTPSRAELVPEPHLVERMIERAFETSAEVTPVSGEASELLAPHEGIGAILRW